MSATNNGGPAFPIKDHTSADHEGMPLRVYFAAKAMQGLIAAAWSFPGPANKGYENWARDQPPGESVDFRDWLAWYSYSQADAMLSANDKADSVDPLISAAPDLLEALKGVLRVADRATDEFDAARAAIAKATGAA